MAKVRSNVVLLNALDKQVLAGKMIPKAVDDLYDAFENQCEVSATENAVFLNGKPLDEAVAELVAARPWLAPPKPQGPSEGDRLAAIQASALAGNVTDHGRLVKEMGQAAYDKWREANKAQPGKDASAGPDVIAEMEATIAALKAGKAVAAPVKVNGVDPVSPSRNPWRKENWNLTRQGEVVRALGVAKAGEIAKAAGSFVGATKPAA
jgi:hypothetical protein